MSENKAVLHQAIENWNKGDLASYLSLYDPNVVLHGYPPGLPPGLAGAKLFYDVIWAAFPDSQLTLDDVIVEGDKIVGRYTMQATHKGDFMGISPTGKEVVLPGITILRFANGKCVERWNQADMRGVMQQLGAFPQG